LIGGNPHRLTSEFGAVGVHNHFAARPVPDHPTAFRPQPAKRIRFLFVHIVVVGQRIVRSLPTKSSSGVGQRNGSSGFFTVRVFPFIDVMFVFVLADHLFDEVFRS